MDWQANTDMGLTEKNQADVNGYRIDLECEASAHPKWFFVTATASWPGGPRLLYDSRR